MLCLLVRFASFLSSPPAPPLRPRCLLVYYYTSSITTRPHSCLQARSALPPRPESQRASGQAWLAAPVSSKSGWSGWHRSASFAQGRCQVFPVNGRGEFRYRDATQPHKTTLQPHRDGAGYDEELALRVVTHHFRVDLQSQTKVTVSQSWCSRRNPTSCIEHAFTHTCPRSLLGRGSGSRAKTSLGFLVTSPAAEICDSSVVLAGFCLV